MTNDRRTQNSEPERNSAIHLLTVMMSTGDMYCLRDSIARINEEIAWLKKLEFMPIRVDDDKVYLNCSQIVSMEIMKVEGEEKHDWWVVRRMRP